MGFSLLEIVVVVAIILMLVLLLLPFMKHWRQHAGSLQCASNLRSVGGVFMLYAGDNNGLLDMHTYIDGAGSSTPWGDYLVDKGYMGREDSMQLCPEEKPNVYYHRGRIYGTLGGSLPLEQDPWGVTKSGYSRSGNRWVNYVAIERPAEYWLLVDSWNVVSREQTYIVRNEGNSAVHLRHGGKANILFADGHVEALGGKRLASLPYNPIRYFFDENYNPIHY